MSNLRTAAQQALEALEALQGGCTDHDDGTVEAITVWCPEVIDALRAALEQPEQEPDRWGAGYEDGYAAGMAEMKPEQEEYTLVAWFNGKPVYSAPPRREWRGLTEEEIDSFMPYCHNEFDLAEFKDFARAIEAALKERNA